MDGSSQTSIDALPVVKRPEKLLKDDKRVVLRCLDIRDPARIRMLAKRVMELPEDEVARLVAQLLKDFSPRHCDIEAAFLYSYEQALRHFRTAPRLSEKGRLLVGAYLTQEYSIEAAALFNPSIVPHPDQDGVPAGAVRFLLSLRATGEGHISSIVFRRGVIGPTGDITFDPPPSCAHTAKPVYPPVFKKRDYTRCLCAMGMDKELVSLVFDELPRQFDYNQLSRRARQVRRSSGLSQVLKEVVGKMLWPARANYEMHFPPKALPAQTVIFPATEYERQGMEDLRLVRYVGENDEVRYFGTYTAADGRRLHPMMLETADFSDFRVTLLGGRYAKNKGMALFPRKVDGSYLMVSRHDGENLFLLRSDKLHCWHRAEKLRSPTESWELLLIGNCGSPIETEAGWLLLTHGVGPLRQYCISASLLDLENPARVIGRLKEPLIAPGAEAREGYVPNVVYSCGSMVHRGQLIIPYAVADSRVAFATVPLGDLLRRLKGASACRDRVSM